MTVGDVVHVHDYIDSSNRLRRVGWPGFLHEVGTGVYETMLHVSQLEIHSRTTKFWMPSAIVFACVWTFEGPVCTRCKGIIR